MQHYHQPLLPNHSYHLFSRAVGAERLFKSPQNYAFFLQKIQQHTHLVCGFWAYSLLPNHFHLFAKIHEEDILVAAFEVLKKRPFDALQDSLSDFVMERFSNCLNAYTKAFNKMYHRRGALFMDYLRRSMANTAGDFGAFVWYVHKNAVHHGLATAVGEWPYNSYQLLLSDASTELLRTELLEWFGGREAFIEFHQQEVLLKI